MNRFDRPYDQRARQRLLVVQILFGLSIIAWLFLKDFGPAALDPKYPATQLASRIDDSIFGLGGVLKQIPAIATLVAAHPRWVWLVLAGIAAIGAARTPMPRWIATHLLPEFDHDTMTPLRRSPTRTMAQSSAAQALHLPPRLSDDADHPRSKVYRTLQAWVRQGGVTPPRWTPWAPPGAQMLSVAYVIGRAGSGKTWLTHRLGRDIGQRARFGDGPRRVGGWTRLQVWIRTRLIVLARREDDPWDVGLLEPRPALRGRPARSLSAILRRLQQTWRPARPTLLILDDAEPSDIRFALEAVETAAPRFRHPVRLLVVSQTLPESSGLRWSATAGLWLDSRGHPADPQPILVSENAWLDRSEVESLCDDRWFLGAAARAVQSQPARAALFAITRGNPLLVALAFEWLGQGLPLATMTATTLIRQRAERVSLLLKSTGMSLAQRSAEASVSLAGGADRDALRLASPKVEMPDAGDLKRMFPGEVGDLSRWIPPVRPTLIASAFAEAVAAEGASADEIVLTAARLDPAGVLRLVRRMSSSSPRLTGALQRMSEQATAMLPPRDLADAWHGVIFNADPDDLFFDRPVTRSDLLALAAAIAALPHDDAATALDRVLAELENARAFDRRPLGLWTFVLTAHILSAPVFADADDACDRMLASLSRLESGLRTQLGPRRAWDGAVQDFDAWRAVADRCVPTASDDQMAQLNGILANGWDEQAPQHWRVWFAGLAGVFAATARPACDLTRLWRLHATIPERATTLAGQLLRQFATPSGPAEARVYARALAYTLSTHADDPAAFGGRESVDRLLTPLSRFASDPSVREEIFSVQTSQLPLLDDATAIAELHDSLTPEAARYPASHAVQSSLGIAAASVVGRLARRSASAREPTFDQCLGYVRGYLSPALAAWPDRPAFRDLAANAWLDVFQASRREVTLSGRDVEQLIDEELRALAASAPDDLTVQTAYGEALGAAANVHAFRDDPDREAIWRLLAQGLQVSARFPDDEGPQSAVTLTYSSLAAIADQMDHLERTRLLAGLRRDCSPLLKRFPGRESLGGRVRDTWWNFMLRGVGRSDMTAEAAEQLVADEIEPLLKANMPLDQVAHVLAGCWHTVCEMYANKPGGEGLEPCERIARQHVSRLHADVVWKVSPQSADVRPVQALTTAAWWEVVRAAVADPREPRISMAWRHVETEMEPICARIPDEFDAQRNVIAAWSIIGSALASTDPQRAAEAARRGLRHVEAFERVGIEGDISGFKESLVSIAARAPASVPLTDG